MIRRWVLGGFILLAVLAAVDLVVAQVRGTNPFFPIQAMIAEVRAPILVGLIHSETGPLAISEKSLLDAEILALEEINAKGGIAGRRLKWVKADGRSDPAAFASQALRLIEQDKVDVLVGGWTAECRKAMLEVVEKKESLLIFPANFEGIERSAHAIYVGGSANQVVLPAVRWCFDALKARRFFVIGTEEVWSRVASEMAKDGIKAAGAELVGESYLPLVGGDTQALVETIRAAKPDVVLNTLVGDSNIPFYAAFRRAGLTPDKLPVVAFAIAEDELRRFPPGDVTGHYSAFSYIQGLDRPENVEFVRKFKARHGDENRVDQRLDGLRLRRRDDLGAGGRRGGHRQTKDRHGPIRPPEPRRPRGDRHHRPRLADRLATVLPRQDPGRRPVRPDLVDQQADPADDLRRHPIEDAMAVPARRAKRPVGRAMVVLRAGAPESDPVGEMIIAGSGQ